MMFMMPMPPTSSEMAAMEPRNDVENSLRFFGLAQELERHDQFEVALGVKRFRSASIWGPAVSTLDVSANWTVILVAVARAPVPGFRRSGGSTSRRNRLRAPESAM
jgi:hypothetical protein